MNKEKESEGEAKKTKKERILGRSTPWGKDMKKAMGLFYEGAKSFTHFQDTLHLRQLSRCVSQMSDNVLTDCS